MPLGPGKYDEACKTIRETLAADGVCLIVVNGILGSGASCQASIPDMEECLNQLRIVTEQMDKDIKHMKQQNKQAN